MRASRGSALTGFLAASSSKARSIEPPTPKLASGARAACTLAAKVRALSPPAAYPDNTSAIEPIETHFAWVFLGDAAEERWQDPTLEEESGSASPF
jgi:hypothetical protein